MNNPDSESLDDLSNPIGVQQKTEPRTELVPEGPSKLLSVLCMIGAGFCLILGTLGFLLPVIPGTPFVLLASFLLLKGSPQFHQKLRRSRFFGRILRDWEDRGGIRPQDKIRAIVIVIVGAVFSFLFGPQQALVRLLGAIFIIIGLFVILRLPPARE